MRRPNREWPRCWDGERRDDLRFALEPGKGARILGERPGDHLDGDVAIELGVAGPIHLPHPAAANQRQDFVGAESRAGSKRHKLKVLANGLYGSWRRSSE